MNIQLLSLAVDDLAKGRDFYDRIEPGLGNYFLDSLYSDIESLQIHAGVHIQVQGYFRALSHRFPFAIYYKLEGELISVWRELDCRQNPARTKQNLSQ